MEAWVIMGAVRPRSGGGAKKSRLEKQEGEVVANPEHVAILEQGVEVWNEWRKKNREIIPDLSGVGLREADLREANFIGANLSRAILSRANLRGAHLLKADLNRTYLNGVNLNEADLSGAKLHHAKLSGTYLIEANIFEADLFEADLSGARLGGAFLSWADLSEANLSETDLSGTDLVGANLSEANLNRTKLQNAEIGKTILGDLDLSQAVGLETVKHRAPSTIGVDTIFKSQGKIPVSFLRGCGVPEDFIKFIPSLIFQPFQFYKCFISHSSENQLFCDRLYADLQSKGVRCWYFPEDARWGRSLWGEIDKKIKIYDKLLVVCSKQSLQSGPVLREIERALQREDAEGKHILFPLRIDNYLFDEWEHPRKADVIAKVAGDFRGWEDPAIYKKAFDRLLRDLKASEE